METKIETTIKISIGETVLSLTKEQAKDLRDLLNKELGPALNVQRGNPEPLGPRPPLTPMPMPYKYPSPHPFDTPTYPLPPIIC